MFKNVVSTESGNGSYKLRSLENGVDWVGKVKAMRQFCFVMEVRGSARHLLGKGDYNLEKEVNSH